MHFNGDLFVMLVIVLLFLLWLNTRFKAWLNAPRKLIVPSEEEDASVQGDAVAILENEGYEVISGKQKIAIHIMLDDQPLESRLFVDYFASMDGEQYIVKLAKNRKPLELTGSAIRDRLLPYQLLYDDIDGILYIDAEAGSIRKIIFTLDS